MLDDLVGPAVRCRLWSDHLISAEPRRLWRRSLRRRAEIMLFEHAVAALPIGISGVCD
jgi:hypothetical protein